MLFKVKFTLFCILWCSTVAFIIYSNKYSIITMNYLLGSNVSSENAIVFWFYWHSVPIAIAAMLSLGLWNNIDG